MNTLRRVVALITVIVIVALIIGTVVCAVTGSKYFFGMLALMFLVPFILWVFNWFAHLMNGKSLSNDESEETNIEE